MTGDLVGMFRRDGVNPVKVNSLDFLNAVATKL